MARTWRSSALALAFLPVVGCGDDLAARRTAATPDAASEAVADATPADTTGEAAVLVFENPNDSIVWECGWSDPFDDPPEGPGTFLDLTRPVEEQTGGGTDSSIRCYKRPDQDNETPGGLWFQSWHDPDAPSSEARLAAGPAFVLEIDEDCGSSDYDLDVTPPLVKETGDTVGPDDEWVSGSAEPSAWEGILKVAHLKDATPCYPPSHVWFTSGIVGVRFSADDGDHYGFVELKFLPDSTTYRSDWAPVRWGYAPEPDQAFTIPP